MKLIDRGKLLEKIQEQKNDLTRYRGGYTYLMQDEQINYDQLERIEEMVASEPVVKDVAPVVHGEWRRIFLFFDVPICRYVCSVCEWDSSERAKHYGWCPNCGAKMEVNDD